MPHVNVLRRHVQHINSGCNTRFRCVARLRPFSAIFRFFLITRTCFKQETFEWTSQRTELPQDSKQEKWAGTGTWISDDTEWRIRLDMREAEAMAASEHQRITGDDYTHMETPSTEVATLAADSFLILSKSGAPTVLGRVPSYKLKQPAPFDIHKALLDEEGSAGGNEDVPKTEQHGDDLQHHEERGRQEEAGKKDGQDGQPQSQEGILKFQDDGLSGTTFEMLSGALLPNLTGRTLRNKQQR
jgi:hypothetical protein